MPTTRLGIPYPNLDTDLPDGADQMQAIAQAIDALITQQSVARGTVPTRGPNAPGVSGAWGLAAGPAGPGLPVNIGEPLPGSTCLITVRFAIQIYASTGASADIEAQYGLNGAGVSTPAFGKIETGDLTSHDRTFHVSFDFVKPAGQTVQLNALIASVHSGAITAYPPALGWTASAYQPPAP